MRLGKPAWRRCALAGLSALATVAAPACCLAPSAAEELLATGFRSPQQTVRSFQIFLRADLPTREYQCFSQGFRARNQLSAFSYGEARQELFRNQPWLAWIAGAEVAGEEARGEAEHWMDLRTLGRTVRVKLVREDFWGIHAGETLVSEADADFDALVRSSPRGDGSRLELRLALDDVPEEALAGATEVLVARHWKIDDVRELTEDEAALETPVP
jgi:hypothetical protein